MSKVLDLLLPLTAFIIGTNSAFSHEISNYQYIILSLLILGYITLTQIKYKLDKLIKIKP